MFQVQLTYVELVIEKNDCYLLNMHQLLNKIHKQYWEQHQKVIQVEQKQIQKAKLTNIDVEFLVIQLHNLLTKNLIKYLQMY